MAIAAFGEAEIIEVAGAGKGIGGQDEGMDEGGAVDGVLAVIACVVMTAGDVEFSLANEGEETGGDIGQGRSGMAGLVLGIGSGVSEEFGGGIVGFCGDVDGVGVTGAVSEAGEGKVVWGAAALVEQAEGVGAGESAGDVGVDLEWEGDAEAWDKETIFAGSVEIGKIGFPDGLIGAEGEPDIGPEGELSFENGLAGFGFEELKGKGLSWERQFAEAAEIIAGHGFFGVAWDVADLVDMDDGAEAHGVGVGLELSVGGPDAAAGVLDFDDLSIADRFFEFKIEMIAEAKVAAFERRIKNAAFETDAFDVGGFFIDEDEKLIGWRGVELEFVGDEIPLGGPGWVGFFGGDEGQFEEGWREDLQVVFADLRQIERVGLEESSGGMCGAAHEDQGEGEDNPWKKARQHAGNITVKTNVAGNISRQAPMAQRSEEARWSEVLAVQD